jgi:hypothetical protein
VRDNLLTRRLRVALEKFGRLHDLAGLAVAGPSIVVTAAPSTLASGVWHDFVALPFT